MSYGCPPVPLPVIVSAPVVSAPLPVEKPVKKLLPLKEEWEAKVAKAKAKINALGKEKAYTGEEYWSLHEKYSKRGYLGNALWRSANGIGQYSMKPKNREPIRYVCCRHTDCPYWGCVKK